MSHTPGPWVVCNYPQSLEQRFGVCARNGAEVLADDLSEANARLIAAAPDLLAALEGLLVVFEMQNQVYGSGPTEETVIAKVHAAIAKATK